MGALSKVVFFGLLLPKVIFCGLLSTGALPKVVFCGPFLQECFLRWYVGDKGLSHIFEPPFNDTHHRCSFHQSTRLDWQGSVDHSSNSIWFLSLFPSSPSTRGACGWAGLYMEVWPQGLTGGVHGGSITQCPTHYQTPPGWVWEKTVWSILGQDGCWSHAETIRDERPEWIGWFERDPRPTDNCELPTKYLSEIRQHCQTFYSLCLYLWDTKNMCFPKK